MACVGETNWDQWKVRLNSGTNPVITLPHVNGSVLAFQDLNRVTNTVLSDVVHKSLPVSTTVSTGLALFELSVLSGAAWNLHK